MNVEIVAVGNEVVGGYIVNTNASYLACEVRKLGMHTKWMSTVEDDPKSIEEALSQALKRAEVIIITGGLGPTPDDLTKEIVCKTLNMPLHVRQEEVEKIKRYFAKKGKVMPKNNEKQAAFPNEAIILPNDCGTAPGCIMESGERIVILLPGPPHELRTMFNQYVVTWLEKKSHLCYQNLDIKCFGIGEGECAERLEGLIGQNDQMSVATYINEEEVIIRITSWNKDKLVGKNEIEKVKKQVEACLGEFIIGYNDERLEENIVKKLLEKNYTVSTVESCTGGMIAATLVNCSGVSECFKEGVVTYSNEAKMAYVDVKADTLARVGAVSEETAREMAEGIRKRAHSDIGLSSTGIAGPGGGTPTKPVGLIYIGIATNEGTDVYRLQLNGTRQKNREQTVKHILFQLYKKLK